MAMKRKLDENGAPTVEVPAESKSQSFDDLNLDPRLLQALAKSKYAEPTPVQARVIPLAGQGANILARSKPGSGKTAAYILPCLQSILQSKAQTSSKSKAISVLVLTPSIELSNQVTREFVRLAEFCGKDIRALNLAQDVSDTVLEAKVNEGPDVLVSTPSRVARFLAKGTIDLSNLQKLVVDEADLVLGYGQPEDIEKISKSLPTGVQVLLVSATLTEEVTQLRETFAGSSFTMVDIEDQEEKVQDVAQYVVKCGEEDKFLLVYVMFKLKLVGKRSIVFVDDVDRSYRLKLFLEQFGIRSCILNHELPVNSRLHAVQEFNKGLYDILIAADDQEVIGGVQKKTKKAADDENEELVEEREQSASEAEEDPQPVSKRSKRGSKKDYGVSRGIDFQNVSSVINFDLPASSRSYTHRVGRTARAGKSGMAISFVIPKDEFGKHKYTSIPSSRHDERVLAKIKARQAKKGKELQDYNFNMAQVEGFRYRMQDALKAVTPNKIREARTREIKQELLKSEKLAKHFEENPEDLKALRHDTSSSAGVIRVHSHMKSVPEYLLPGASKKQKTGHNGFVSFNKPGKEKDKKRKSFKGRKPTGKRLDPLKSFKAKRK